MKKFIYWINIVLIFLFCFYCARFQFFDLTPNVLLNIPLKEIQSDTKLNSFAIPIIIKENLVYNIPQNPVIWGSEILLPIPEKNFFAYYSKITDNPDFLITSRNLKEEIKKIYPDIPIKVFSEGIIGQSCIQNDYFAFQIYQKKDTSESLEPAEPENRMPAVLYPQTKDINPYKIYIVNKANLFAEKNKEQLSLIPVHTENYQELLNLFCFNDHISMVRYISEKEVSVTNFDINTKELQEESIDIKFLQEQNKNDLSNIENVIPLENKEIFIEVVFRDKKNYQIKNKKIYKYFNKNWNLILDNDDLDSSLFFVFPDNSFYLVSQDDGDLIIKIYDSNVNYIKNNRIKFNFEENYWKEYFINSEGRIFSTKMENHNYIIVEWK